MPTERYLWQSSTMTVSKISKIKAVVLQGDTMASLIASVNMDTIARDWLSKAGNKVYKYRDTIDLGTLGMLDDLLVITEAGVETTKANAFINIVSASKGYQFSDTKCSQMLVTNKKNDSMENIMKVDKWIEERNNGVINDVYSGKVRTGNVLRQKYMGLYIQSDRRNSESIDLKTKKAAIIINKVKNKVADMKAGKFTVETVSILRESVLLGNLLYGTEVMYNLSKDEIKALCKLDMWFLKETLNLEGHIPDCLLLLELGLEPIEVKIIKKRVLFLKYMLDQPDELCCKVLMEQVKDTSPRDWWNVVKLDLEALSIELSLKEIQNVSSKEWKKQVKHRGNELALATLLDLKSKLKYKGRNNVYPKLRTKAYLLSESGFYLMEMKLILKLRTDMLEVPKCLLHKFDGDKMCRSGCMVEEDISHTIECNEDNMVKMFKMEDLENVIMDNYTLSLKPKPR